MGSISFRPNFKDIDRSNNISSARKAKGRVKSLNLTMLRDSMIDTHDMLENILKAYEEVEPKWKNRHNRVEGKKPEKMQSIISPKQTINDILEIAEDDELAELSLCITVSNRIAHTISDIMKKQVREYAGGELEKDLEKDFMRKVRINFDAHRKNEEDKDMKRKFNNLCSMLGTDIEQIKKDGFPELVEAEQVAFSLKEYSLRELITKLKDRDDINYGKKEGINQNGKRQDAFIMDLPFYGQFSVHLMAPKLETQGSKSTVEKVEEYTEKDKIEPIDKIRKEIYNLLIDKEYDGELYEKNTVMLNSNQSEETNEFLKSLQGLTEEEQMEKLNEVEKKDERYGHHLKVAGGYDTRGVRNER